MIVRTILLCLCPLLMSAWLYAQEHSTVFPSALLNSVSRKASPINHQLDRQTARYLKRMFKHEKKIMRKLYSVDSAKATEYASDIDDRYTGIQNEYAGVATDSLATRAGQYFPHLDSVKCALGFLQQNKQLLSSTSTSTLNKLNTSLKEVNGLQNRLGATDDIKRFISERKKLISETLGKYTKLPKSISNSYNSFTKQAYYYSAQVREYKAMLHDQEKMERKALEILRKLPAFTEFMKKNSFLSALFPVPDNYGTTAAIAGLQTRADVQSLVSNRMGSGGPNAENMLQQNIQSAQSQMNLLKDKINKLGGGGDGADIDMPDFTPNQQKTKSFFKRLELGGNMQTTKSNYYFPTTTDLSFSIGYRLTDKSVAGIGSGYKIGLGKDIRHIAFTSEGINFRSFLDVKLKGSIWITGGLEYNYRNRFRDFDELKNKSAWSTSALAGLSKKYSISKKVKGEFKLLYDALWRRQQPNSQPIVFRIGYSMSK